MKRREREGARVSKHARLKVERGGNTDQYIQTSAHTKCFPPLTQSTRTRAHNFPTRTNLAKRPAGAARSILSRFLHVLDDLLNWAA